MKSPYKLIRTGKLETLKADYKKILESNLAATTFIKEIENGNLDAVFSSEVNEEEALTKALLAMQEQLQKIAEDEKERNWATQGLALFAEILRADSENSTVFYQKIISELVKYLNANQGGLFLINDEDSSDISIELVSCYAYNRQKFLNKKIYPGEGLIGQCYLEKETIFMTDIPQSYVQITSGLGTANPGCLLIVPLKINEQVHGFVELASFDVLKPFQVEFLERLGESIASSIATVKINHRTKRLLEDAQHQAEEMRAQEEEMRQNMEELSATQEGMERAMQEVRANERYVKELMDGSSDSILVVDKDYKIIDFNPAFLEPFKHSGLIVEKNDSVFKVLAPGEKDSFMQLHSRALNGESFSIQEHISGVDLYFLSSYSPLRNPEGEIYAAAIFAKNVTELVKAKNKTEQLLKESQQQAEEMRAQEEEMRQNMEELSATQEEMHRILQEVQGKEAFMNDLINSSNDSILTIDKDYKIISCNTAMQESVKVSGLVAEKGVDMFSLIPAEQKEEFKAHYDRVLKGESFKVTEKFSVGGEHYLYLEMSYNPLRNEKGEISGIVVFNRDVSQENIAKRQVEKLLEESQQQAEELRAQEEEMRRNMEELMATREEVENIMREVELSERHTRHLIDASKDLILVIDEKYHLIDFNAVFATSYKAAGVVIEKGINVIELLGEGEDSTHKKLYDRALKGESFEITDHIPGPDLYFLSTYSPLHNIEGKVYAVAVFARNITEMVKISKETEKLLEETGQQTEEIRAQEEELRQNMEELSATQEEMEKVMLEIQEQEQHFEELLNGTGESIFAIDPQYKVISWNNAFEATFGRNGNGISKGMDILEVFPPEERPEKKQLFNRVLAGETVGVSTPFENDGVKAEVHARHIPLRNKSGEVVAVGIFLKLVPAGEQAAEPQGTGSGSKDDKELPVSANGHEKTMAELVKGFNVAFDIVNRRLELVDFNAAFKKLVKKHFHVNVHKGMHISDFMKNEKEREETKANIERAFKGESLKQTQKFVVGDRIDFVLLKYVPLKNKKGEIEAVGVYSEDITEIISMMEKNKELIISGTN